MPLVRSTVRRAWLAAAVGVTLAIATPRVAAAVTCATTGEPAPAVPTLLAAKTNPATDAWVVSPDCVVATLSLRPPRDVDTLDLSGYAIELADSELAEPVTLDLTDYTIDRVVSVPTETIIFVAGGPLLLGADFSMAKKTRRVILPGVPADISTLVLPPSLESISIGAPMDPYNITSLDGIVLPSTLKSFALHQASLVTQMANVRFPASLESILIENTSLQKFDLQLPASVKSIFLVTMTPSFGQLDQLTLPSRLESFKLWDSGTATIRGIRWPSTLKLFDFSEMLISDFEIRRSDVPLLNKLYDSGMFLALVTQVACTSPGATLETVANANLCVLADADFDTKYKPPATPPTEDAIDPTPPLATPNRGDSKDSVDDSPTTESAALDERSDRFSSKATTKRPRSPTGEPGESLAVDELDEEISPDEDVSGDKPSSARANGPSTSKTPKSAPNASPGAVVDDDGSPTQPPRESPISSKTSGATSHISPTVIALACALACVVGGIAFRAVARSKTRAEVDPKLVQDPTTNHYTRVETPTTSFATPLSPEANASAAPAAPDLEALRVAFMTDQDLVRCRIDKVQIGPQIAEGGFGVVLLGSYQRRTVAVKQLPPEAWATGSSVANFLDEIRLCARLDHPKIVEFIGVSWSGGRDLAAVSEFMAGGDLKSILQKYPSSTGSEWASPWTEKQLRTKTLIALDVVEAVVYLHSFNSPILHRDLKTKNVLLDTKGNAKLSDFGISRELSIDETMTSDIGTTAWIAPEVLRGDRYSEKADIYSLGVLLVELDRCSHPYANEPKLTTTSEGGDGQPSSSVVAHQRTQIAVLVSTGQLRPAPTPQCPSDVAEVVAQCLNFEAEGRPTAMEVFYQLRQVRKRHDVPPPS